MKEDPDLKFEGYESQNKISAHTFVIECHGQWLQGMVLDGLEWFKQKIAYP